MIRRLLVPLLLGGCLLSVLSAPSSAMAAAPPEWRFSVTPNADYFLSDPGLVNGETNYGVYKIEAENVGGEATSGEITIQNTVPPSLSAAGVRLFYLEPPLGGGTDLHEFVCPSNSECRFPTSILEEFGIAGVQPGKRLVMFVLAEVPEGLEGSLEDVATISGGGAAAAEASATNLASPNPPFGTLHYRASVTDAGGSPYTQAGGHPFQFSTQFNFESYSFVDSPNGGWDRSGTAPVPDAKDITNALPPGLIANPQAVPRCKLADYFAEECERTKVAVGDAGIQLFGWTEGEFNVISPIFNLEPSGEYPGQLGITIAHLPLIVITTGVRTGSDYGVTATSLAAQSDLTRVRLNLWGVPADEAHDGLRGKECQLGIQSRAGLWTAATFESECEKEGFGESEGGGPAEVEPTPFVTMPTECSGNPLLITGLYDTWDLPGEYAQRSVELPAVDGCNSLQFSPTIEARPTTNLADAPSGFEFHVHVPQNEDPEGVATPELKEAVVRLPKGLSINPAAADGRIGCTEAQIGLDTPAPPACPDASKLGSAEVLSPLLNEPLLGAIYLATPHQNPFGSLLAGYVVVEGQGIRIKLAGQFETDPVTGQITTRFTENPQLPFEDLKLHIFEGARGALRTPAVCGAYETTSELTPFSAPESGPAATPSSEFETTSGPTGGECAFSEADLPDAPRFHAGTETPQAGIYSPFALKLVRDDGTQEVSGLETTLPKGLVGRLAGTSYCPEASIAAAEAKTGKEEQSSPSCPASSEVGTVDVGAGAGPTPLNVPGHVYLAGPYKGAPLSMAIITPAVAGPFDLGTVVVRAALHVDPETTQIHAVSDPIPTILEGIPLDRALDHPAALQARLHPQPDRLLRIGLQRLDDLDPRRRRTADPALPGRRLPGAGLQAEALPAAQGRHQAHQAPRPHRGLEDAPRRCQHRRRPGHPAALRHPRPGPHRHDLHQSAVRRQRLPGEIGLRAGQGLQPAARPAPGRPGLPALLKPRAARPRRRPERPDPGRSRRPRRRRPRTPAHNLRSRPRCPRLQVRPADAGRQEGPAAKQDQHLQLAPASHGHLHRPQRQEPGNQPGSEGALRRASQETQAPPPLKDPCSNAQNPAAQLLETDRVLKLCRRTSPVPLQWFRSPGRWAGNQGNREYRAKSPANRERELVSEIVYTDLGSSRSPFPASASGHCSCARQLSLADGASGTAVTAVPTAARAARRAWGPLSASLTAAVRGCPPELRLIKQSRPNGEWVPVRPLSPRPAGIDPVGTTQGEEI